MNQFHCRENRYREDPLFAAQSDKRDLNKKLKKVRAEIDYHARSLGHYGSELNELETQLTLVNVRLKKLKKE